MLERRVRMPGTVTLSEAPTTGLGKLIKENEFFVPTHQRDYRWDEDRVKKLLDDLTEAIDRGDQFYFIGLMVFMRTGERLRVLDGQQRLATTIVLFSAIRAWFGSVDGGTTTSSMIQSDFIGHSEYGESEIRPRLNLNINNNERFQRYVVNGSPMHEVRKEQASLNKNAPNYDLLTAIVHCHARISEIVSEFEDVETAKEYLFGLVKFIRDAVIVVRLTVPSEANAFRVFETLNDRGLDLSAVDLVKNHVFGLAHDHSTGLLSQVEHRWSQLTHQLTDVKESDFLRVYWTSRYGRTQLDQVFDEVRNRIRTGEDAEQLTLDLLDAADHYVALDSSEDPTWSPFSKKCRQGLSSLRVLGSRQVRPVLLSAIVRFTAPEFEKLVWLLETVLIRWQVIGGRRTGMLEITCARLAHKIWENEIRTGQQARAALESVYTSDSDFRVAFGSKQNLSNQKAAYLLRIIEFEERKRQLGANATELEPGQFLSIEHILPKKDPGPEWEAETAADPNLADDCSTRLGNTCLLTEKRNRRAARKGFDEKKKTYAKSDILTTGQVSRHSEWNRQSIENHQDWLASRAVGIWKFT